MITVYGSPSCVGCKTTMHLFARKNVPVTYVDVTQDEQAMTMIQDRALSSLPVVLVTDDAGVEVSHWSGLRPDLINTVAAA